LIFKLYIITELTIEEDLESSYELTDKGKKIMELFDREYIKAWKKGHTEHEAEMIALSKINEDSVGLSILRFIRESDKDE
jgi:hypothetical protein